MNFARREIDIILVTILNRYDLYRDQKGRTLKLYDTIRERNIDVNSETIVPMPVKESRELRVKMRS